MMTSWRFWLRIGLLVFAVMLVWTRIISRYHTKPPAARPTRDFAAASPLNQPGGAAVSADAYEVYSALYRDRMPEPLAFAENSVTDVPQVDGSCLKPSTPQEHEMTDTFIAANRQSHRWEQHFSIAQGYRLIPGSEMQHLHACLAAHGRDIAGCESYKQLRVVRYLGVPGFDRTHTRALVSVIKSCSGLCGSSGIFAIEKKDGTWQRSATTAFTRDCSWMY